MIDPLFWVVIALIVANGAFLTSVAVSGQVRSWYKVHYRWYAAFVVLTALVAVLISAPMIFI